LAAAIKAAMTLTSDEEDEEKRLVTNSEGGLNRTVVKTGLRQISRTADRSNYAFVKLELPGLKLDTLDGGIFKEYKELRYVNVRHNFISSLLPLSVLPNLLSINAQHNQIRKVLDMPLRHLQLLELDYNEITALPPIRFPSLFALTLAKNKIENFDLLRPNEKHDTLELLDLSYNSVTSLRGLRYFAALRLLSARGNRITKLDGLSECPALQKIDLSDNAIESLAELKKLASLPKLSALSLSGNPALAEEASAAATAGGSAGEPEEALLLEVLMVIPRLVTFDNITVTAKHRTAADALYKERLAEKKRKEEEDKKAKEEGGDDADDGAKKIDADDAPPANDGGTAPGAGAADSAAADDGTTAAAAVSDGGADAADGIGTTGDGAPADDSSGAAPDAASSDAATVEAQ